MHRDTSITSKPATAPSPVFTAPLPDLESMGRSRVLSLADANASAGKGTDFREKGRSSSVDNRSYMQRVSWRAVKYPEDDLVRRKDDRSQREGALTLADPPGRTDLSLVAARSISGGRYADPFHRT